jgi:hypothetical protein
MKKCYKYLLSSASIVLLTITSLSASQIEGPAVTQQTQTSAQDAYIEECKYIDTFLENENKPENNQIWSLIEQANDHLCTSYPAVYEHFTEIMNLGKTTDLENQDWYQTMSTVDRFVSICLSDMFKFSGQLDTAAVARALAFIYSPELADDAVTTRWRKHSYPLVANTIDNACNIKSLKYRRFMENLHEKSSVRAIQNNAGLQDPDSYLNVCYMTGTMSTYQLKTFFYALSKGVGLEGISSATFAGHGGSFPFPTLALAHDGGHMEELRGAQEFSKHSNKAVTVLKNFAKQFLQILDENEVFLGNENEHALLAAFMLIHETQIKQFIAPCLIDQDRHVLIDLKQLFLGISHKLGYNEFKEDYPRNFYYRFYSDLAFELIKIKPELKNKLFPDGVGLVKFELNQNHPFDSQERLSYNLDGTIEEAVRLMQWLQAKLSDHLEPVRVVK